MTWMAAQVKSAFKAEEFSIKRTILWTLVFTDAFFLSCLLARLLVGGLVVHPFCAEYTTRSFQSLFDEFGKSFKLLRSCLLQQLKGDDFCGRDHRPFFFHPSEPDFPIEFSP